MLEPKFKKIQKKFKTRTWSFIDDDSDGPDYCVNHGKHFHAKFAKHAEGDAEVSSTRKR